MKIAKASMGIRNKLVLSFIAVVLISLLALGCFLDLIVKNQTEKDFIEATTREVAQVDNAIGVFFEGLMSNTKMLATDPLAKQTNGKISVYIDKKAGADGMISMTPIENGGYEAELYRMFEQFGNNHPQVSVVSFGTSDGGYLQWPAISRKSGYDSRTRDWYKNAVDHPNTAIISDPFMTSKGVPTIGIFSTVQDESGILRGVLGLNVDLPAVTDMIENIRIGKSGYVILLDSKGMIIANPKHNEFNFKPIKEMGVEKLNSIGEIQNESFTVQIDGVEQLANVYTSPKNGWKYLILVEKTQLLESVNKIRQLMLAVLLAAILLTILAAYKIANQIATPIKTLEAAANRIALGDISITTLDIQSNDELGRLGRAFETMSRQLRELIGNINQSSEQVLIASGELTAGSEQSAQSITHVAGAITEVAQATEGESRTVDKMVSTVQQVSDQAKNVAKTTNIMEGVSEKAGLAASGGEKAIQRAVGQMSKIEEAVATSANVVSALGDRSTQIGTIVETISGIAGQTNLLALNAAVEAARAGEQGKGFAVVAEEVRKLAEQSQEAAKQIGALIHEIQDNTGKAVDAMELGTREVRQGSEVVNAAGKQFSEIISLISQVNSLVKEAAAGTDSIAGGSQQLVIAVQEIDEAAKSIAADISTVSASTEQQSAAMQQITSSSHSLTSMAENLKTAISKFKC